MTNPTSEEPFPPDTEQVQPPPPPFDDQLTFPLTKPINLAQLGDEIQAALSEAVRTAQVGPDDPMAPISQDNQATLAVSPSDVDAAAVTTVIEDHQPTDGYDVPEHVKDFDALLNRIVNEPDAELSGDDLRVAIRGLMLRVGSVSILLQP